MKAQDRMQNKTKSCACAILTNLLSDLLKTGLAGITHIGKNAIFLAYCPRLTRKSKNGEFTVILKCILWDFDNKSGYFFIFAKYIIKLEIKDGE